jgi:hypothetical protein
MNQIDPGHLLRAASELLTDDDANPEYDRAIVELTCDLLSIRTDAWRDVLRFLQALKG